MINADVDIDVPNRKEVLPFIKHVPATIKKGTKTSKHNSGVYIQDIPVDPVNVCASIDYKEAERRGYFKLDLLNNSIYEGVRDEDHLNELIEKEPLWDLLLHDEFLERLAHVRGHGQIVRKINPRCVEDLAIVIALPRPGKYHLQTKSREVIDQEIWKKSEKYYYKKSHAYAFALSIVVQMNLLLETI